MAQTIQHGISYWSNNFGGYATKQITFGSALSDLNTSIEITPILSPTQALFSTQVSTVPNSPILTVSSLTSAAVLSVSSLTSSSTVATAVTSATNNFYLGQSVTIAGATPSAYNGTYVITAITNPTTFTYTFAGSGTSPATGTITASALTTATAVTSATNNFYAGQYVTISGASPVAYNGTYVIKSIISATSFTYTFAGSATTTATGTIKANVTTPASLTGFTAQVNVQGSGIVGQRMYFSWTATND